MSASSGASACTAPRWKTRPRPSRARAPRARGNRADPGVPRAAPGSSAAPATSPFPASRTSASISSTNSGLPSAASRILSRRSAPAPPRRPTSASLSAADSGSSRTVAAFSLPPPQPGRRSSSSGLAMHSRSRGASRDRSATCSTRSRNVCSAQWMSSKTQIGGRAAARSSSSLRNAQAISSAEVVVSPSPMSERREAAAAAVRGEGLELLEDLDDGPVRDPLAVREAAAAHDVGVDITEKLVREARLPDPGASEDSEELARAIACRAGEGVVQCLQLPLTPDHRDVVRPRRLRADRAEPKCAHGRRLPLQFERLDGVGVDRVADQRERVVSDEDLARGRRLLQARGDVDRVAGCKALVRSRHDLASVDADPRLHAELRQGSAHLVGGADGSQRVVLVDVRDAEHRHDGVPHELLNGAAVCLDDPTHALEVAGEQGTHGFGVHGLAERCRAGDVAEEDADNLPLLPGRRGRFEPGAAIGAEGEVAVDLSPAPDARQHAARLFRGRSTVEVMVRAGPPRRTRRPAPRYGIAAPGAPRAVSQGSGPSSASASARVGEAEIHEL